MKFGCCTSPANIEVLARAGYDFIDFPGAAIVATEENDFTDIKKRLSASGLTCEGFHASVPPSMRLAGPLVNEDTIAAHFHVLASRARDLGCTRIGLGSPKSRSVNLGSDPRAHRDDFLRIFALAARICADHGVSLLLEALRLQDANFINTQAEALAILSEIREFNVGTIFDLFHFIEAGEKIEAITPAVVERIGYLHIAEPNGRGYPKPENNAPYRPVLARLKELGYTGDRISVECPGADFSSGHESALRALRELYAV
ncbi:MAG: sugar phosphate isomerase/epimerase family protein [Treponemataceae bacterium]